MKPKPRITGKNLRRPTPFHAFHIPQSRSVSPPLTTPLTDVVDVVPFLTNNSNVRGTERAVVREATA